MPPSRAIPRAGGTARRSPPPPPCSPGRARRNPSRARGTPSTACRPCSGGSRGVAPSPSARARARGPSRPRPAPPRQTRVAAAREWTPGERSGRRRRRTRARGSLEGGETDDESKTLTVHKPERRARQLFSRIKRSAVSNFLEIKNLPTDAEGKKRIGANRPSVIRPPMIALSPPPHLLICHREAPEKCHTGLGKRAGTFGHGHAVKGLEPSSHTAPRASNATTTMALTLPFLSFSGIKLVPVRCARAPRSRARARVRRAISSRARPAPSRFLHLAGALTAEKNIPGPPIPSSLAAPAAVTRARRRRRRGTRSGRRTARTSRSRSRSRWRG